MTRGLQVTTPNGVMRIEEENYPILVEYGYNDEELCIELADLLYAVSNGKNKELYNIILDSKTKD